MRREISNTPAGGRAGTSSIARELRGRIVRDGPISFAEFMEAALYSPNGGYYTRPGRISSAGDYYTSPSAHPAFGALIAIQLREMAEVLEGTSRFTVVELGAGDGTLGRDIMAYASRIDSKLASRLRYVAVDRAAAPDGPFEAMKSSGIPVRGFTGCILSNELLDAAPVHRFVIRDGRARELLVGLADDRFVPVESPSGSDALQARLGRLTETLPDRLEGEANIGLDEWAMEAYGALKRGFVLTIDYGSDADALYSARRATGTIVSYRHHLAGSDALAAPGEQDISAHVDFTAYAGAMHEAGFSPTGSATQAEFLGRLGLSVMIRKLRSLALSQAQLDANRMAMLALARKGGLGDFKIVAHSKDVPGAGLAGFGDGLIDGEAYSLPVPLLSKEEQRIPLLAGKYPGLASLADRTWSDLFGESEEDPIEELSQ